ncbi:hypothetical protein [Burkholderia pseudomallei]|uniref:hypothetical protein n=1 Tax=Burkholderia pseudomallei TaxID=28450 RepID=UPI00050E9785|nr:hypothetical protein [Burkholderia pseudomallei]KGC33992.1 hypothetical protein DO73_2687 [Burkholderia pseudomallei]KGD12394.1 hypothetical protein DP42_2827 [Burkholderia pseudomallei]
MMTGHRPERSGEVAKWRSGERVAQRTRDAAFAFAFASASASAGKRKVRRTIVFRHDYLVTEANASGLPRSGSASRLTPN